MKVLKSNIAIPVLALLLMGSNQSSARRLHKNKVPEDNMMLQIDTHTMMNVNSQIDTHGIFDKAIAKIEREENEKTDAINLLNELHEKEVLENKRNSLHQKHVLAAQKEAASMLQSMTQEAEMTAQEKLETIVSDQIRQEDEQKRQKEEDAGVDGFLSGMNKISRDEVGDGSIQRELAIKEKVQTVVAPKMAQEALSQALDLKQYTSPNAISLSSISQMKKNLANKISAPAPIESVAQTDVGEGSALDQFDQLKVLEQKSMPEKQKEESVSGEQEQHKELDSDSAKLLAAHKRQDAPTAQFLGEMNKEIEQDDNVKAQRIEEEEPRKEKKQEVHRGPPKEMEDDIDNPLSAYMAMKHPEIMEHAKERQYDDEMFSHYNNGITFA